MTPNRTRIQDKYRGQFGGKQCSICYYEWLEVTPATAIAILARFERVGVLREITGQARYRVYRYDEYLALFDQPATDQVHDETGSNE